ncbi:MAG: efflux RND transporter periplasmic adaptor subunit [Gemmatimonas sp.]|nr:efflux RND transporter periplasmic adaptor subunit [Gemmatimonas sp.]
MPSPDPDGEALPVPPPASAAEPPTAKSAPSAPSLPRAEALAVSGRVTSVRHRRAPRRTRWRWLVAVAIGIVVLAWGIGRPLLLGPRVTVTPVLRADLVQTLVASGHVETPFRVSVSSQVTGVVMRIPVAQGQRVRAGDTLLLLDAREARALAVQAEGQLAQAVAKLRQVQVTTLPLARLALAEATTVLRNEQQKYDRNLAALGFDSPASRDAALATLEVARARVRSAELQVAANSAGGSDYVLAEAQLAQAQANLEAVRARAGYLVVTAPRAGVLIGRTIEAGDVVQPGKELMVLSPVGDVDIVVRIDERNLGLVAVGQSAMASVDAYPTETFPARVHYINPAVDRLRASVEVKLRVPTPPAYLRQDMTVTVDIEAAIRPHTLIVPTADIHELDTPNAWVLTASDGRARKRPVQVGLVSGSKAEILSGVSEGDLIVPRSADSVEDGHRLRVQATAAATAARVPRSATQ